MHSLRLVLLSCASALLAPTLAACGGGGGGNPDANQKPVENATLPADADRTSGIVAVNGVPGNVLPDVTIGKVAVTEVRGIVVFPWGTDLPAGSEIVSATLTAVTAGVVGNPTVALGALSIDHVDPGATTELVDFGGGTLTAAFAHLLDANQPVTIATLLTEDVTTQVRADGAAGRTASAFRLAFPGPSTSSSNQVTFSDAGLSLVVQFRRP